MGRPRIHDDATRTKLLLAAEHLAESEGLSAVSVRRLASKTGLSTRAVYSTFGSMEGLIDALGALAFHWACDQIELIPETDDPVSDVVEAMVQVFRRLVVERTVIFQIGLHSETRDGANPLINEAAGRAQQLAARKVGRFLRPELVRDAVLGIDAICEGLAALELRGNFDADRDPDETWRTVLSTYLAGMVLRPKSRESSSLSPRLRDGEYSVDGGGDGGGGVETVLGARELVGDDPVGVGKKHPAADYRLRRPSAAQEIGPDRPPEL